MLIIFVVGLRLLWPLDIAPYCKEREGALLCFRNMISNHVSFPLCSTVVVRRRYKTRERDVCCSTKMYLKENKSRTKRRVIHENRGVTDL